MITVLSALLAAAAILVVPGPPSEQHIYFSAKPAASEYKPLAREAACLEVLASARTKTKFNLPVTVHMYIDVARAEGTFVPDEFFTYVVTSCHDTKRIKNWNIYA